MNNVQRTLLGMIAASGICSAPVLAQMPGMPDMPVHKDMRWTNTLFVLVDQLEYAPSSEERLASLDGYAWYGNARTRLWLRTQGEVATAAGIGEVEAQLLFGRLVDPFWDAVAGIRVDQPWGDDEEPRVQLAVGFMGLAPYRFELEPTLFVSHRGELSGRLEAAYSVLLTQRLIAEPEIELNAALQEVPEFSIRRGLNDYELGLRFRYEFRREFAPYVGWSRSRRVGITPTNHDESEAAGQTHFVAGFRLWR